MEQQEKKKKSIPKPTHFGKNVRFLRRMNALSQQELATALGINRNNIASYESGYAEPSALVCLRVCEFFGKTPVQMLDIIMADDLIENVQVILPKTDDTTQEMFEEALESFMQETFEMTKMYDGYRSLVKMKNIHPEDKVESELYGSFSDLLDLLQSLISLNWDIMHRFVPSDITEQNRTKS